MSLNAAGGPAIPHIAGEVAAYARPGVSGALEMPGKASGTIHLSQGYICFAECSLAPDLATRLVHSGQVTPARWNDISGRAGGDGDIGGLLLGQALLTPAQLRSLLRSITLDALVALASALDDEPFGPQARFRPGGPHWAAAYLRLDPASMWADVGATATRLGRYPVPAGARPQLCRPGPPWTVVEPGAWAVACRIDGTSTVRDLAQRNGLALCDVQEWVGRLGQAGLCRVGGPGKDTGAGPAGAGAHPTSPAEAAGPGRLPRRKPGATLAGRPLPPPRAVPPALLNGPELPGEGGQAAPAPHPDVLHRVLHGLRRLS